MDNNGVIYLHDVSQEGTFDLIRTALNVRYHDPDPKAKYMKWNIGEPCIALYHYDNSFYRGRVMEVNEVTSNCLVHYIDYGNEEVCSFTNMRKSIALHQIPTQAHKCVFNRIQPAGKQWERQTLDYVHKLIVEKHCYVKVSGNAIDGITPIDMKYDKLWINDHLVDFDLARYTDGAKPVERKFVPATNKVDYTRDVAAVDSDSGPDFIVEDDEPDLTLEEDEPDFIIEHENISNKSTEDNDQDSFDLTTLKGLDWNTMLEQEDDIAVKFIKFPKHPEDEFKCNIAFINDYKIFPLTIINDAETSLMYQEMFHEIQQEGENMTPLTGIYKDKACVALFEKDNQWYRAMIMEYSEEQNRMRVRYVDYGNVELISLAEAREIHEEWVKLPPLTVAAKFHGVCVNTNMDANLISKEFSEVLLEKGPFDAKIINTDEFIPIVELRDSNNELVTEKLIKSGVFLKC